MSRASNTPGVSSRAVTALAVLATIAVIVLVFALVAWAHDANERRCRDMGGTVVSELETKTKNGKTTTTREYECIVNGEERFEW